MDLSYCNLSYWFPHVVTYMPTFQIHFMSIPHAYGMLGVLNLFYSQCCGIVVRKLNCSYRHRWNGALHCGHLFLATIKVIRHCGWYMCWQVPRIHAPSSPNGEQQIKHSPHFTWSIKVWATKVPHFFLHNNDIFLLNLGCVTQSMFTFFYIFSKLLWNISHILGHDVKLCDQNLPFSWYSIFSFTSFASIYIAWYVAKIHARCMWFEFRLVTFTHT